MRFYYNPEPLYKWFESKGIFTKKCEKCKQRKPIRFFPPSRYLQRGITKRSVLRLNEFCHACCDTPTIYLSNDYVPPSDDSFIPPPSIRIHGDEAYYNG